MSMPVPLLAKSRRGTRFLSVERHCLDTEVASRAVFAPETRTLKNWCRFFQLDDIQGFSRDLAVACLFHDIGKANADFYAAVTATAARPQGIRHEHLSALVLCLDVVRNWLASSKVDFDAVAAAVLSHHAKASTPEGQWPWARHDGRPPIETFLNHPEVTAILARVAQIAKIPPLGGLPSEKWPSKTWEAAWSWGRERAEDLSIDLPNDETFDLRRNHILAVKAATVVADSVASAFWRENRNHSTFLEGSLHRAALTGDDIRRDIVNPRIEQLKRRNGGFTWDRFQEAADGLGDRAAIVAACGAGKTLAAWRWAAAVADKQQIGSVVFLYPTRATATEGFKDYVALAPEGDARLLTGTAQMDLAGLMRNPPESLQGNSGIYESEEDARLFALANWQRRYFSATLDQFLSFLEHGYSGLCLMPQLADAAVIIDEAHSLDRHLFERLCAFLLHFRVPVLLMTATLPRERMQKVQDLGLRVFPTDAERTILQTLSEEETRPRYRLIRCRDNEHALAQARAGDQNQARSTLWVINTVKRCQEFAFRLRQHGINPMVFHSRFRARDRRQRHRDVVDAFQKRGGPVTWAVTTQVCEMSLDLDADRLVTEDAPLPALIQRMGRANRSRSRDRSFRGEIIIYRPPDGRPYDLEDGGRDALLGAARFADRLAGQELGQRELAECLLRPEFTPDVPSPTAYAGFLSGGWYATAQPLRGEDDNRDVRCLLTSDLDAGLGPDGMPGDTEEDPLDAWIVQVPRRFVLRAHERPSWMHDRHLHLTDGARYRTDLGFLLVDSADGVQQ